MAGLYLDRSRRGPSNRSRPTVELRVSVQKGAAFQMDHHPLEVGVPDDMPPL